ncbi:hypothetical protein TNCV_877391 [Trichonephila clavipes]|nr:hypothetical protein TNCV_877391 [Trichonephila clavipes]
MLKLRASLLWNERRGLGSLVVEVSDRGWLVTSSNPVPLKTRHRARKSCSVLLIGRLPPVLNFRLRSAEVFKWVPRNPRVLCGILTEVSQVIMRLWQPSNQGHGLVPGLS